MDAWRELTFPVDSSLPKDSQLIIEDDRAVILIDPLRWSILETLGSERSVASISQILGVTDARILYHLRRLAQTGVVQLEEDETNPGKWHCRPMVGSIRVRETHSLNNQDTDVIPSDVASQFNQASREVSEGLYDSTFQMSVNHNRARLSEEQASEFNRRLLALIEDYFPPGKGDQSGIKYGFYGILTPIDLHPLEDDKTE